MADQPILGYRELTDEEVSEMNGVKEMEQQVADLWKRIGNEVPNVNHRWCAVARTHFQEGFTALCRAIARPDDPFESKE